MASIIIPPVTWRTIATNLPAQFPFSESVVKAGYKHIEELVLDMIAANIYEYLSVHTSETNPDVAKSVVGLVIKQYQKASARKTSREGTAKLVYMCGDAIDVSRIAPSYGLDFSSRAYAWRKLTDSIAEFYLMSDIDFMRAPSTVGDETDTYAETLASVAEGLVHLSKR